MSSFNSLPFDFCLPEALSNNAQSHLQTPFWTYSEASDDLRTLTHRDVYLASLRVANLVKFPSDDLPGGLKPSKGKVVALVANSSSVVYHTVVAGLMVAGYVPFPISSRNSAPAIINLLNLTDCRCILATKADLETLLSEVSSEQDELCIYEIPTFEELYIGEGVADSTTLSSPKSHLSDPESIVMYLHSSGSTGFPKAIPFKNKTLVGWMKNPFYDYLCLNTDNGSKPFGALGIPPFHGTGIIMQLFWPIYYRICVAVFPPASILPSPSNVISHMKKTGVSCAMVFPSILTACAENADDINYLKTLTGIFTGSGPLPEATGDYLVDQGVQLRSLYGGTEFGVPTLPPLENERDWRWMRFHDRIGVQWDPQGDGSYEAQFLSTDDYVLAKTNMQGIDGYATSDLWVKHPTIEGLWRIIGRKDDVLIHSNGEKTVPGPMEAVITSNPKISAAVMFGRERDRTGVLIEPATPIDLEDSKAVQSFRDAIWPMIERGNEVAPNFSRIYKEMIIFTSPLPRTAKGTVMRKIALEQYKAQIDKAYQDVEAQSQNASLPKSWSQLQDISAWLFDHVFDITKGIAQSSTEDLFHQGFDSLSATFLRLRVQSALRSSDDERIKSVSNSVSQNFVYDHPSVTLMAKYLFLAINEADRPQMSVGSSVDDIEGHIKRFNATITPLSDESFAFRTPVSVLITGTTGNLGAALLRDLLLDKRVHRIYAINRSGGGSVSIRDRQVHRFIDNGYSLDLLSAEKLTLVEAETEKDGLGIDTLLLEDIRRNINLIVHNAWRLNFNLAVSGFEDNIKSTRNLINLALSSPNPSQIRFLFCSSIGVSQSWDKSRGPFPEELQLDPRFSCGGGYGEAKYICERLLNDSGLNSTAFRIGQITGGKPQGAWSVSDWVPIMLRSSMSLETLPSSKGRMSWLSCDAVASSILDVAFLEEDTLPPTLNINHPKPIAWDTGMDFFLNKLSRSGMHTVRQFLPFSKWFARLESAATSPEKADLDRIPAIKLLEFFRGFTFADEGATANDEAGSLGMMVTEKAQAHSLSLRSLKPLRQEDIDLWVDYWMSKGLFD